MIPSDNSLGTATSSHDNAAPGTDVEITINNVEKCRVGAIEIGNKDTGENFTSSVEKIYDNGNLIKIKFKMPNGNLRVVLNFEKYINKINIK